MFRMGASGFVIAFARGVWLRAEPSLLFALPRLAWPLCPGPVSAGLRRRWFGAPPRDPRACTFFAKRMLVPTVSPGPAPATETKPARGEPPAAGPPDARRPSRLRGAGNGAPDARALASGEAAFPPGSPSFYCRPGECGGWRPRGGAQRPQAGRAPAPFPAQWGRPSRPHGPGASDKK